MRIGTRWTEWPSREAVWAAERGGAFALWADVPGSAIAAAAELAVRSTDPRIVLRIELGSEHPVTLAEEAAVLDHLCAGRVVCVVDSGDLDAAGAAEDLGLLRAAWSGRPVSHHGRRHQVPAHLNESVVEAVSVTPTPSQVDIPVWLDGACAVELSRAHGLPVLATAADTADPGAQVQPAVDTLSGDVAADRALVASWAAAGATHLLAGLPVAADLQFFAGHMARYLQPEVAMPHFPRIIAESDLPAPWVPA